MVDKIVDTFELNIGRLQNLLKIYKAIGGSNPGRTNNAQTELLRAMVVLTHSTLEDFLRSLETWRLPNQNPKNLKDIWLKDQFRLNKFSFQELVEHKSIKVEVLLNESIKYTLDHRSYNQPENITKAIENCGLIITEEIKELFPSLKLLMDRRHHIVHQADKNNKTGRGQHKFLSLSVKQVKIWIDTVDSLANSVIKQV